MAVLAIISNHMCDSDDVLTTRWRGAADKAVHGKKKCVTEVGVMNTGPACVSRFSMCDHVAFKVWNTKTKRWEL
ncbi:MAG: hypothetical protein ACXV2A_06190 [Halobacteriota archaeon]